MTPETATTLLGLAGHESPDQIRAIYAAQAAALDARIAASEGEARERYRKDRDDVELARLALLGSDARREPAAVAAPAPKGKSAMDGPLGDVVFALAAVACFAIPASITGWFIPLPRCTPGQSAGIAALAGPAWLLAGLAIGWPLHWIFKRLLGWSVGPFLALAYVWMTHFGSGKDKPVRMFEDVLMEICVTAVMGTLGSCLAVAVVVAPIFWIFGKFKEPPPGGEGE